jgi:hypothetical protein
MTKIEEMWVELAKWQPEADKLGYGVTWAEMCELKTAEAAMAAMAAAGVAWAAAHAVCAATDAWAAARAAARDEVDAVYWEQKADYWAQKAIDYINKALGEQEKQAAEETIKNLLNRLDLAFATGKAVRQAARGIGGSNV